MEHDAPKEEVRTLSSSFSLETDNLNTKCNGLTCLAEEKVLTGVFLDVEIPSDSLKSAYTGELSLLSWVEGMLFLCEVQKKTTICLQIINQDWNFILLLE